MILRYGASAIDENWVYLCTPYEDAEDEFEVYEGRGQIYLPGGFRRGNNNIFVTYTAGYSSTTMPDDLKLAVKIFVKTLYSKWKDETWNLGGYKIGDITMYFGSRSQKGSESISIPTEVKNILDRYRKLMT